MRLLRERIISCGAARDLKHLFFFLHDGEFHDLAGVDELCELVEAALDRVEPLLASGEISTDPASSDGLAAHDWRAALNHMAEALDSLNRGGYLAGDGERETAHRLLTRLCAPLARAQAAREALHCLRK